MAYWRVFPKCANVRGAGEPKTGDDRETPKGLRAGAAGVGPALVATEGRGVCDGFGKFSADCPPPS